MIIFVCERGDARMDGRRTRTNPANGEESGDKVKTDALADRALLGHPPRLAV